MKKTALLIAFLLVGFFGFGQSNRPYVIRYASQGEIIQHNTQSVSSIHIDTLGQELIHDNGTEWSALEDLDTVYVCRGDETVNFPLIYNNLQTDDWNYLIRNEAEQLLVYKESDIGIVAFGINSPCDSIGFFFTSNDSIVSITSNAFDFHILMKEDSVLFIVNEGGISHFYKYDHDSVFNSPNPNSCKLDNADILSALFSAIIDEIIPDHPVLMFINMVGTLRELDEIGNIYQLLDWLENGNHVYDIIFGWARSKENEHNSNPSIIAGISTGGNRVEGTTAYCLVDGYIKLQADIYFTGTLSANYGVCYSTSPNPTIQDSKQELSVSIGNNVFGDTFISQATAVLPYDFCISGLEESTTYYYRAFYEIGAIDELVYGEIKQFTTEGLFEINTMASPSEGGTVTGGGRYPANTTITLTATANSGYEFTHWEDGGVLNTRTITVEEDATYIAYFEEQYFEINTIASPSEGGTVTGGGIYNYNTQVTLTATANSGYEFTHWDDGSESNPRVITVGGDGTYTAYFEEEQQELDISGTWTCTETHYSSNGEPYYTSYEITLNEDGTVDCPTYPVISEGLGPGTYSVGDDGSVSISIIQINYYSYYWQTSAVEWYGTIEDLNNPTTIIGYRYNWNVNYVGYFEGDHIEMIMTR